MTWYYSKNGQQMGPVSEFEFQAKARAGEILPTDLVWREGMVDWKPLSQFPEYMGGGVLPPKEENQGGGQVAAPQRMSYDTRVHPAQIPNYLWQSIVVTLLCCWPIGVVGIVYATRVDGLVARGDYAGAEAASKAAKTWTVASFVSGFVVIGCIVVSVSVNAQ